MLYNETLKRRYIEEKHKNSVLPNNYLEICFKRTAKKEHELGKDVSNFTAYEILEYYKTLNISVFEAVLNLNSQLSQYTQWCLQQNLVDDNQNHFLELSTENFKSCINHALVKMSIVSRETVLDWIKDIINPKDQFMFLAVFEGLKGDDFCELWNLKPSDVDGNTLHLCTGRSIEVSDELINLINDCIEETQHYTIKENGEIVTTDLIDRGYVIKNYRNTQEDSSPYNKGRSVYRAFLRILTSFEIHSFIKPNSIFESGKIDMIKRRSKELGMTAIEYIYSDYITEVEKQYNSKMVRSTFIAKYENYLK